MADFSTETACGSNVLSENEELSILEDALQGLQMLLLEQPENFVEIAAVESRKSEPVTPVFGETLDEKTAKYADSIGCNYQGLLLDKREYKIKHGLF